ncbi:hypothetical protein GGF49_001065 [Coemansia sp. RSA 1853]|nr:hypothetical protein GGF49_001065 [Coemansia sp. RSA 1853]
MSISRIGTACVLLAICVQTVYADSCSVRSHALFKRDSSVSGRRCTTDEQCAEFRIELDDASVGSMAAQPKSRLGEYACISGSCRYVVKAGELCFSAHDCAAFQLNRRWETANLSAANGTEIDDLRADNATRAKRQTLLDHGSDLARAWCAPDFCTLESTCGGAWTLPGAPHDTPQGASSTRPITNNTISCCRGFQPDAQCAIYSSVDSCASGYSCSTPSKSNTEPLGKCTSQEPHQIWIGVVLVLIGGATLNIGLNLQKYAFRKRQEKINAENAMASDALSPAKPSDVFFFSSDALRKPRSVGGSGPTDAHVSPVYPASVDHIYSQVRGDHVYSQARGDHVYQETRQPLATSPSITETISAAAGASRMSRISLTSIHNSEDLPPRRWLWQTRLQQRLATKRSSNMPIGNPVWLLGLAIFILGNAVNFIALQFAPQSLVAPLGAVSLVTNVIIAPLLNNEKIGLFDIGGIALIIAGCVIVVVFSGIVQQNFRLCVLVQLLKAKSTVLYLCVIFAAILAIYVFLWSVERGVARYHEEYRRIDDEPVAGNAENAMRDIELLEKTPARAVGKYQESNDPLWSDNQHGDQYSPVQSEPVNLHIPAASDKVTARMRLNKVLTKMQSLPSLHPLMVFDRYIKPISPNSRKVRFGLPLAYASLGSFMAALTTLFAKSLVNLLSASLFDHDNQFTNFMSWAILLITAFTAASQVYWINQGLLRYDALLQVPVFYVVWTVFDIIGGGIYFNEFRMFTTIKYVLFVLGVCVIFSGVGLLANRLKHT